MATQPVATPLHLLVQGAMDRVLNKQLSLAGKPFAESHD